MRAAPEATPARGQDGQRVVSHASGSYLGLELDPRLARGAVDAIRRCASGASRWYVRSPLYTEAEAGLERIFGQPVVIAQSTTLAHAAALPTLLDPSDVVLFDAQVHHSVQTALASLGGGPRARPLPHDDLDQLEAAIQGALARGARRVWYCADGVYGTFGDRLPLAGLRALMERYEALHAYLDDAHGMSWAGRRGVGTVLGAGLPRERTIVATSLSNAFGASGGALVVPDRLTKERIENLGPSLMFGAQLPPPVLGAIAASAAIHASPELDELQSDLEERLARARALVRASGALAERFPALDEAPTPVQYVVLGDTEATIAATRHLLALGILVNAVAYPAVPRWAGGVRFTITRAHELADVERLVHLLGDYVSRLPALRRPSRAA